MPVEKPSAPQTPIELDKDAEYFWDFVLFSCEGCVFRVPKYRFISDSEVFATKFGLNADTHSDSFDISVVEAPSTLSAIELDVSAEDFRHFLKALHPRYPEQSLELSKGEWLSVLRLSTKWFFNDFRKRAIDNLTALDLNPVEKVYLGAQFNVSSWLKTGFRKLVTRTEIITVEDARQIGLETAIKVYGIRDGWNKLGITRDESKLDMKIEAAFASELGAVYNVERQHLPARERQREEEAATAKELEKREESKHQEELERLQKAVEDVGRLLEEHNAALDDFKKAQRALTNAIASPNPTPEKATTPPATSATAAAAAPAPSVLSSASQTPSAAFTNTSSSTPVSAPTPAASFWASSTEAAAKPATTTGIFGSLSAPAPSAFSFGGPACSTPSKTSGSLFGMSSTTGSSAWAFGK